MLCAAWSRERPRNTILVRVYLGVVGLLLGCDLAIAARCLLESPRVWTLDPATEGGLVAGQSHPDRPLWSFCQRCKPSASKCTLCVVPTSCDSQGNPTGGKDGCGSAATPNRCKWVAANRKCAGEYQKWNPNKDKYETWNYAGACGSFVAKECAKSGQSGPWYPVCNPQNDPRSLCGDCTDAAIK